MSVEPHASLSAGIRPPPASPSAASPSSASYFIPSLLPLCRRCLLILKAVAFPPRRPTPLSAKNLPVETPASPSQPIQLVPPSTAVAPFAVGSYRREDPLVSKLRTQLGVIHPLPAPLAIRSVVGLFAVFLFIGATFDKLWTLRKCRCAEREVKVNSTWPHVPTSSFLVFLEEKDLQRKESVELVLED